MTTNDYETVSVAGKAIKYDRSGRGHCWINADSLDCPADTQEEIAAEIINGKMDSCSDYVASNGLHYRW